MWRSIWFWLALIAAVLTGVAAWAFHTTTEVEVSTAPVTDGRITRRILATGTVQAVTTVEVGAQVSGIIASLGADFNSLVHAGQIVATLDASSYDAQLREAVAGRTEAEAALKRADADVSGFKTAVEDAQMKLERAEALWDTQLIPRADLDAARVALDEAKAASGRRPGHRRSGRRRGRRGASCRQSGVGQRLTHDHPIAGGRDRHRTSSRRRPDARRHSAVTGPVSNRRGPRAAAGSG